MKKFLIILAAVAVLGLGMQRLFPRHGGGHFRPAAAHRIHRPVIVKHKASSRRCGIGCCRDNYWSFRLG